MWGPRGGPREWPLGVRLVGSYPLRLVELHANIVSNVDTVGFCAPLQDSADGSDGDTQLVGSYPGRCWFERPFRSDTAVTDLTAPRHEAEDLDAMAGWRDDIDPCPVASDDCRAGLKHRGH